MKYTLLFLAASFAAPMASFAAGLTFTVSPDVEFGPPGGNYDSTCQNGTLSCLIFSSIITSDDTNDYNLTDVQVVFNSPSTGLSLNDNFFLSFGPAFILAGDPTFTGPTFEIDVDPSTAFGAYSGTATLIGGTDPDPSLDTAILGSSSFQVEVTPEPAYAWPLGLALAAITLAARRRIFH